MFTVEEHIVNPGEPCVVTAREDSLSTTDLDNLRATLQAQIAAAEAAKAEAEQKLAAIAQLLITVNMSILAEEEECTAALQELQDTMETLPATENDAETSNDTETGNYIETENSDPLIFPTQDPNPDLPVD